SETIGDAPAGNIQITADRLRLTNGAQITSAGGDPGFTGQGGDIAIAVTGTMSMDGTPTRVTSKAYGDGNAGAIGISAGNLSLTSGARIDSSSDTGVKGAGGAVSVAAGVLSIAGSETGIFSETKGEGAAGNVAVS